MKIGINEITYDAVWYDFEDGSRLKIRVYPFSKASIAYKDGSMIFSGNDQCDMFKYCLVGWEGIEDQNGKALACTDEVKQKIFDFRLNGIPDFVAEKGRQVGSEKEEQEKNLTPGDAGTSASTE